MPREISAPERAGKRNGGRDYQRCLIREIQRFLTDDEHHHPREQGTATHPPVGKSSCSRDFPPSPPVSLSLPDDPSSFAQLSSPASRAFSGDRTCFRLQLKSSCALETVRGRSLLAEDERSRAYPLRRSFSSCWVSLSPGPRQEKGRKSCSLAATRPDTWRSVRERARPV